MVVPHTAITWPGWELYKRCKNASLVRLVQSYQLQERQDQQWNKHCVTAHPWQRDDF